MTRSDRLPLVAVLAATLLAGMLSLTGNDSGAGTQTIASGDGIVAATAPGGAPVVETGLHLVDPGAVSALAAQVVSTTTTSTTTTTTTTTTAPPPPPPTTSPPAPAPTPPAATASVAPPPPPPTPTAPAPPPPPPPAQPKTSGSCAGNFGAWMNSYRGANGVGALTIDGGIASIPTNWSVSMARNQSLAHNPSYGSQIRSVRPASAVGENVGYSSSGDRAVFDNMLASGGHRAAILNGGYTHAATGCAVDGQGKVWVTVDFWG